MSDRENIEEIKSRLDIVPIVEKHVKLRKAGKNFVGLCPFHSEKTPSFIVSPSIQRYKCFGCGESGDIFNFVEKTEHLDFVDVLEKLAKEAGLEYHAWIPALKQFRYDLITNLVNRLAERILPKQADYSCSFSRAKFCGKKNSQAGMG